MDNEQNMGSFMAPAGGGQDALRSAMQRRGIDASILSQVGNAAPVQENQVAPAPDMAAAQAALPQTGTVTPEAPQPESDVTIAMKALSTVVTNDSKMKRDLVNLKAGQPV